MIKSVKELKRELQGFKWEAEERETNRKGKIKYNFQLSLVGMGLIVGSFIAGLCQGDNVQYIIEIIITGSGVLGLIMFAWFVRRSIREYRRQKEEDGRATVEEIEEYERHR